MECSQSQLLRWCSRCHQGLKCMNIEQHITRFEFDIAYVAFEKNPLKNKFLKPQNNLHDSTTVVLTYTSCYYSIAGTRQLQTFQVTVLCNYKTQCTI